MPANTLLRWEKPQYPTYFFPNNELPAWYLHNMRLIPDGALYDIAAGHKRAPNGLTKYSNPISPLEGFFKLDFNAMDAWFEEDEEIFVHPKDPYKVCCCFRRAHDLRTVGTDAYD